MLMLSYTRLKPVGHAGSHSLTCMQDTNTASASLQEASSFVRSFAQACSTQCSTESLSHTHPPPPPRKKHTHTHVCAHIQASLNVHSYMQLDPQDPAKNSRKEFKNRRFLRVSSSQRCPPRFSTRRKRNQQPLKSAKRGS